MERLRKLTQINILIKNKTDMASSYVFTPYGEEKLIGESSDRNYYQNNYFAQIAAGDDFVISIKRELTSDSEWTKQDKYAVYYGVIMIKVD